MNVIGWLLLMLGVAGLAVAAALQTGVIALGHTAPSPPLVALVGLILCGGGYGVHKLTRRR